MLLSMFKKYLISLEYFDLVHPYIMVIGLFSQEIAIHYSYVHTVHRIREVSFTRRTIDRSIESGRLCGSDGECEIFALRALRK